MNLALWFDRAVDGVLFGCFVALSVGLVTLLARIAIAWQGKCPP